MRLLTIYKFLATCVLIYSGLFVKDLIPMKPDVVPDTSEMEDRLGQGSDLFRVEQIALIDIHSKSNHLSLHSGGTEIYQRTLYTDTEMVPGNGQGLFLPNCECCSEPIELCD